WSLVVVVLALTARRDWKWVRPFFADRSQVLELLAAAVLIAVNWLVYVWAVEQERVLEASLGYFINPLVTVGLGVALLGERLRPLQWVAVALGAAAVLVIAIAYGSVPFISLTLAFSFAGYGYIKKRVSLNPLRSLTAETAALSPVALAVILYLSATGSMEFGSGSLSLSTLLALSGLVTAIPLILFAASARRIPLTLLGLLQYLTPVMQFLCAVFVFHESMATARWIGFGLVWAALGLLSLDSIGHYRNSLNPTSVSPHPG
ncbi:MAG TPA: EamA family transporter RarD, partial [Microthrixaceae bacterium]|nr:EamA family transporter RarD [Microthrixaceae bacterium]